MKKSFQFTVLFFLFSFSVLTSCRDDREELLEQPSFYVVATSGSCGRIFPHGIIKMKERHPSFRFVPDKGYKIDSVYINNVYLHQKELREYTFSTIYSKINTIRVTFTAYA